MGTESIELIVTVKAHDGQFLNVLEGGPTSRGGSEETYAELRAFFRGRKDSDGHLSDQDSVAKTRVR